MTEPMQLYDVAQPRDKSGKWTLSGGAGSFRIENGLDHYKDIGIPRGENGINTTWDAQADQLQDGSWYGDYRVNDDLRVLTPDEPHNYQDHAWAAVYARTRTKALELAAENKTIESDNLMLDTSPDNPVGVNSQAIRYWSEPGKAARDKGGIGHQSYIQDGAARMLGMTERGHNPSVLDRKTDAQYDQWGKNLLNSIDKAPAAQPTLWRGIDSRDAGHSSKLKALKPGSEFDVPLMSTSRDANATRGYGSDYVLRIAPGSKGIANRSWFPTDQEVITGGRYKVTRVDTDGKTTVISVQQAGTWSVP